MSLRFPVRAAAALLIAFSGSLLAQGQEAALELQRLQLALSVINGEIKANLDEVMALQEAGKASARTLGAQAQAPGQLFDDVAAAQQRAIDDQVGFNARIDAILERNAALNAEKQPLLERVRELLQEPQ